MLKKPFIAATLALLTSATFATNGNEGPDVAPHFTFLDHQNGNTPVATLFVSPRGEVVVTPKRGEQHPPGPSLVIPCRTYLQEHFLDHREDLENEAEIMGVVPQSKTDVNIARHTVAAIEFTLAQCEKHLKTDFSNKVYTDLQTLKQSISKIEIRPGS